MEYSPHYPEVLKKRLDVTHVLFLFFFGRLNSIEELLEQNMKSLRCRPSVRQAPASIQLHEKGQVEGQVRGRGEGAVSGTPVELTPEEWGNDLGSNH